MKQVAILLAAASCWAATAGAPFTIDQVMNRPFTQDLKAGPGGRIAWIVNLRGIRNVWAAEAPEYRARPLTNFTEDDGMELSKLSWLPDGRGVVFVRGGDSEHPRSEFPNPLSKAEGVEQAVWVATWNGSPRKIADGDAPEPVPGSNRVLFVKGKQIFSIGLADADKPVPLAQPRGNAEDLLAAPDGSAFAFVSQRGDHSFIGVYRFSEKSLRYLDASVDSDLAPVWSRDSRRIAFVRIAARTRSRTSFVREVPDPWSIRVADAATGKGQEVWRALPGPGSAFHGTATPPLLWASGGRIVFPWERDGWCHLYSVSETGGGANLLTPGDFEVEQTSLSPDGREVFYSSNEDDIDRRHVWRVAAGGGSAPAAVTRGKGVEWSPVSLEAGAVAYFRADAKQPARAAVMTAGGATKDLALETIPAEFPGSSLVEPEQVIFPAADGMAIHGQLFMPPAGSGTRKPALIFFHGGSRRQMLLGWHYMYYYNNAYAMNQYLASQGYIVLSVNYRSGIGYGLNFREAINYGPSGASEYNDVIGAGLYLRGRNDVDPRRIGLWGGSYGGYLTALGLARGSALFAAGVDFHGVHDWTKLRSGFEPGSAEARTAFESSPLASVKTWRSPVLLIHGDDDRNVTFGESVRLAEALRAQQVDFEQLIFPDEIHDFLTHGHWVESYRAAVDFLTRKMK